VNPHAIGKEYVEPGHMHRHGRHALARPLDRLDDFLAQVLTHERIADLHETELAQVRWTG